MSIIGLLLPVSLALGGLGLCAFFWSLRSGQFDDLEGDQYRVLFSNDPTDRSAKLQCRQIIRGAAEVNALRAKKIGVYPLDADTSSD